MIRCMQNKAIFKLLNPKDNIILSEFNNNDLKELLYYINEYYLELRSSIALSKSDTFGFELEVEKIITNIIRKKIEYYLNKNWDLRDDRTLEDGCEVVSPMLCDKSELWLDVDNVCRILNKNAYVWYNSSGHIHMGTQVIGSKLQTWKNFLLVWSTYENIIYRFLYGEYLTARESITKYASPLSNLFYKKYQEIKNSDHIEIIDITSIVPTPNRNVISFEKVKNYDEILKDNTVEFRGANNSLNGVIWQNNTIFLMSFVKFCKKEIDIEKIERRRKINEDIYDNLFFYDQIYLDQAIELCDMIFDKNIDKVYFLRQYLKSFQVGNRNLQKAKRFTKKNA